MKPTYLQLFMNWDLTLKYAKDKAREVEKLHMKMGGSHPSFCTITSQAYMAGNTHVLIEDPHMRIGHVEKSELQVFKVSTIMGNVGQALELMQQDHELPLRVNKFTLSEVDYHISYGIVSQSIYSSMDWVDRYIKTMETQGCARLSHIGKDYFSIL